MVEQGRNRVKEVLLRAPARGAGESPRLDFLGFLGVDSS
jgi:hypothetical protein